MVSWYNENDPFAAAWLRELIAQGHIAPGNVDERSIEDVHPDDLRPYTQCHFFAGIGVWSHALRCAGWPDDRPIWTGSCPCQPFSAAGKGGGFADERHLWPAFLHLIQECEPRVVVGEQVASKDGLAWLDLVQADLEATDYAFGAVDLCAAGVGAPHIRQRAWWMADASCPIRSGRRVFRPREGDSSVHGSTSQQRPQRSRSFGWLADDDDERLEGRRQSGCECPAERAAGSSLLAGGVDDTSSARQLAERCGQQSEFETDGSSGRGVPCVGRSRYTGRSHPLEDFWRDADWLGCRDGKWRPVEPGAFPLAHGLAARVGRLRGYGNALVSPVATLFLEAVMDCLETRRLLDD